MDAYIYKHCKISTQELNNILMPTLDKISVENINPINYDSHNHTSHIWWLYLLQYFIPISLLFILQDLLTITCHTVQDLLKITTRHTIPTHPTHNNIKENAILGKLITGFSYHLAKFLITSTLAKVKMKPIMILTKNFKKF